MSWVKLHRKLAASDLWLSEPFTRGQAWVDLILRAGYRPGFVRIRNIRVGYQRGQLAVALRFLEVRWGWSVGKVQRFLNELEATEQISTQKNNVCTLITITNYELYQGSEHADAGADELPDRCADVTQIGAQTEQIKEVNKFKKQKREKKGDTPQPPIELPLALKTPAMDAAIQDWLQYKRERREAYKPTGLRSFLKQVASTVALHGESEVITRMQTAMAAGWKGWSFPERATGGSRPKPERVPKTRNGNQIIPFFSPKKPRQEPPAS